MQGIGLPISRLFAARAVFAGAALLAGAAMRPVQAEAARGGASFPDETAMAVPRVMPPAGPSGVGLPQPLPLSEAARIRRIFALQRLNLIPAAVAETGRLTDTTLLGHILADRLLAKPARATAPALSDWLGRYADLPDACAIYAVLLKRLPPGTRPPAAPPCALLTVPADAMLGDTSTSAAGPVRTAFVHGQDAKALRLGKAAFEASHRRDSQAAYVAGLAAWRLGRFAEAAHLFENASLAEEASASLRAGGAYWAGRAYEKLNDHTASKAWMLRASSDPHTLHGMLARQSLGLHVEGAPASAVLAEADVEAIAATPQGHRAFALLQVGEDARAEAELRLLWPVAQASPPLARALFLTAGAAGLTRLVSDLSGLVDATDADLPVPILRPQGGYLLDPALVYAIAHVESNFKAGAQSKAGAHGLMQLMPVAANEMLRGSLTQAGLRKAGRALRDSGQNLKFGQQYLAFLSHDDLAGDDLLRVLASYNCGPFAVRKWQTPADHDPVMFLEAIESEQTRRFVQRTLTNIWGYSARFALTAPSLAAMAAGKWPAFRSEILRNENYLASTGKIAMLH